MTDWFEVKNGIKQGDNFSPQLASFYLNDMAIKAKNLSIGVKYGDTEISLLMYADDIAFIAGNESDLQRMLNTCSKWCNKWQTNCNIAKT